MIFLMIDDIVWIRFLYIGASYICLFIVLFVCLANGHSQNCGWSVRSSAALHVPTTDSFSAFVALLTSVLPAFAVYPVFPAIQYSYSSVNKRFLLFHWYVRAAE